MRILLTNDDGVHAPGLAVLREIAGELSDDVTIVAPQTDQSGAAHALTLNEPLRMRQLEERVYAVRGTPTDCVLMAVHHLMKDARPDLVLSGINSGQNAADEVTYSGTIAGAIEGTLLGIPAMALSLAHGGGALSQEAPQSFHWETPMAHGARLIRRLLDIGWREHVLLNINFPACAPDDVAGVAVTRQAYRYQGHVQINERRDTRGDSYYWLDYARAAHLPGAGTDVAALMAKNISVSPLYLDLTHEASCQTLAARLAEQDDMAHDKSGRE